MKQKLIYSNCLIEAIRLKIKNPRGKIGCDLDSPSGLPSFYFKYKGKMYKFRRKLRRYSNKGWLLFYGYQQVTELNQNHYHGTNNKTGREQTKEDKESPTELCSP